MTLLRTALHAIADALGDDAVREIAGALEISPLGSAHALHARLEGALGGDPRRLVCARRTPWRLDGWNALLDELGGARQKTYARVGEELARLVRDRADSASGVRRRHLPDDVFGFDAAAGSVPARGYQRELVEALAETFASAQPGARHRITVATGGGKTRIANDWIATHALPAGKRVLWVTKDWALLRQAAADLARRHAGASARLGYVGAQGATHLHALSRGVEGDVVYTTIHSLLARMMRELRGVEFDVVVIDESHWGEGKRAYRELFARYGKRCAFLGLTATPREGTGFALVGRAFDFPTLAAMGVLARPIAMEPVQTGVRWAARRSACHGDFDCASLRALASSPRRNRVIVETYRERAAEFGKTLIFACDIEHARALRYKLGRSVAAEAVHSGMREDEQRRVIERFRTGKIRVLINVAMLTHGVDIPDIETVFLARPTSSRGLFAQMAGRAARVTPTKTHFRLVDFVDNLVEHEDVLVSAHDYFGELESEGDGRYRRARMRSRHAFRAAEITRVQSVEGFESVAGFDVHPGQTFGIEFELTRDGFDGTMPEDWSAVASSLLAAIPVREKARRPWPVYHHRARSHAVWNVEWDTSCGWEVTSRVLAGESGFFEVIEVCAALEDAARSLGLRVNYRTGTHVHLAWNRDPGALRRLMQLVAHYEPALYTLVAPSRATNRYCVPVRERLRYLLPLRTERHWRRHFSKPARRYLAVNPSNLFSGFGTIELRAHSGTLSAPKILAWISLWMCILAYAQGPHPVPAERVSVRDLPLEASARGDVRTLAEGLALGPTLTAWILRRREQVMARYVAHPLYHRVARALMARWKRPAPSVSTATGTTRVARVEKQSA